MLRALGCIRVSTAAQATKGYSLPEQAAKVRAYCALRGYLLLDIIEDAGESGRLVQRPGLVDVLRQADEGRYDVLVPVCIERFGRENRIILNATHELHQRGIVVDYVEDGIAATPEQVFLHEIKGSVAGLDWAKIRAKTMEGRRAKAESGRAPCAYGANNGPLGYRVITRAQAIVLPQYAGRDGELEVVETEAALVRELFARYDGGASLAGLASWLNERGTRTRRGGLWSPSAVRVVLEQPAYVGRLAFGRRQVRMVEVDGKKRQRRTSRPADEWTTIPCPAIVEEDLWTRVQVRLASTLGTLRGRESETWLLRGCVVCADCRRRDGLPFAWIGHKGVGRSGQVYRRYECSSIQHQRSGYPTCGGRTRAEPLEARAEWVVRQQARPGALERLAKEELRAAARPNPAPLLQARKDLGAVNLRLSRLADQALEGLFPAEILAGKAEELRGQRTALLALVERLEREQGAAADPETMLRRAETVGAQLREDLAGRSLQEVFRRWLRVSVSKDREPTFTLMWR